MTRPLAGIIPWVAADADGLVTLRDGGLLAGWRITGHDLHGLPDHEAMAQRAALHHITAPLGDGWRMWTSWARRPSTGYFPQRHCAHPAIAAMEEERRAFFTGGGTLDSEVFVWLACFPRNAAAVMENWLFSSPGRRMAHRAALRARVREQLQTFEQSLGDCVTGMERLAGDSLEAVLESIGSFRHVAAADEVPASPFIAERFLGCSFDGSARLIDGEPVRTVTLAAIPSTTPRTLDLLRALPFSFLMSTRTEFISPDTARSAFRTLRANLSARGQGLLGVWLDGAGNNLDPDARAAMDQLDREIGDLVEGAVHCHLSVTLVFRGPKADEQALEACNRLRREGIRARIEGIGTAGALLGALPGNRAPGVRVLPMRLIHAIPFWPLGIDTGARWQDRGAFLAARRVDGTVRVMHSDLLARPDSTAAEHGLVIGPTGAGKSTLLSFMALSWLARPGTRVVILDRDRSCRSAVLACGGLFHEHFAIQPLREADGRALDWLLSALRLVDHPPCADDRQLLQEALWAMKASEAEDERTIGRFLSYLATRPLRDALAPLALEGGRSGAGAYGRLIDGVAAPQNPSRLQAWEMSALCESRAAGLGFDALMPRIEAGFDGAPTLLLIDEAWDLLARSTLAAHVGRWLRTLRKKRVAVWLFSQSMSDVIAHGELRDVLTQQTQRQVLLPNAGALEGMESGSGPYAAYRHLGLSDRAIHLVARSRPRRDVLLREGEGASVLDLCLGSTALALTGRSGIGDQHRIDRTLDSDGHLDWRSWLDAAA